MNKTPRVVVITGGGSGIGLDASVRFGQLGDTIIIIGRTESKLKNVQSKIRNNGGECIYFTGDVADPTFVNQATNEIIKKAIFISNFCFYFCYSFLFFRCHS